MRRQTSKVCGTPLPHYLAWAKSWRGSIASNAPNTPLQPRNIETPTPDRHGDLKDEDHEEGDASGLCTRDALEEILKSYVASESPFSYHKAFPHAPNPELHISGLGDIELPLNQADFDTIKSKCRKLQAQEGVDSCESSSQDRVGCVWALGASIVHLHSPLWPEFMSKIVEETCQTLMGSVLRAGSRPQTRCNLRELLLYETGSRATVAKSRGNGHTSPTQVLVFLPSRFTGGVVQLVCSGKSVRYDCSERSLETNVIAWQPESTDYEMKRVTDGHRLAFLFDLNFDVAPYPVAIPTNIDLLGKLRTVLRRWKLRKSRGPEDTLVYLLRYIYDQDDLCADSLKGVDKIRFSALQCLANELGFQVSLSDCRYFRKQESPRVWDDSDSDDCSSSSDDDDEVAVGGRVVLTGLIDPEGNRVPGHVDLELAETIPRCLRDVVEDDYDKNQIREKGEEQSTFHSESHYSVLVLWDYATLYSGPEGLKQAMKHLKKMLHRGVAFTDLAFIHHVLSRAEEDPQPILHMVCDIACRWDKPNLWMKAVMICYTLKTPAYLSTQKILTAVDELGFASIQAGLECILDAGLSNVTRLELLKRISERAEELPAAAPSKITMQEWVASQTSLVLNNLKKPRIEEGEEQALLLAAQSNGGIIFLEEHLLQQILDISDHKFLCTFALSLHYDDDLNSDTKDVIVAKLLSTAISKATFFAIVTRNASELRNWDFPMITGDVTYSEAYPDDAEAYLELVQQLGHSHLFNSVIEKVMDTASLTPLQAQHCAEMLMLPMINFLVTDMHVDHAHASSSKLKELQETGIQLHIDGLLEQERQARDKRIEWTHAVPLLDAALVNMNGEVFMKRVWPYLLDVKMRGDGLRNLTEEVVAKRHAIILPVDHAGPSVQEMITTLAKRAVDRSFDFSDVVADTSRILKLFSFCFKCNTPDLCEEIANKIIAPENLTEGVIEWRLGSFLLQLKEWAEELGRDLDRVVQKIALACVETTPKAPRQRNASHCEYIASLAAWTCGCQLCEDVREFLKSDRRTYNLQDIGSPSVKHVRKGLQAHARELVTSTLVYTKPQSLSLAKPTAFHRYILWKDGRSRALKFLRDLSPNDDELRRILGPTYSRIHRILGDFSVKVEEDVDLIPVDSQSLPPPSPTSPSQSSLAPRSAHVSRGTIPQGQQETSQSGKRRSNTNPSGRTQVKRQKMGEKDSKTTTGDESEGRQIIDLTLDSDSESDVVEYL